MSDLHLALGELRLARRGKVTQPQVGIHGGPAITDKVAFNPGPGDSPRS